MVLVSSGQLNALRAVDELSFALAVVGVVIAALAVLGGRAVITTWNDIDTRMRAMVEKYERENREELRRFGAESQKLLSELVDNMNVEKRSPSRRAFYAILYAGVVLIFGAAVIQFVRASDDLVRWQRDRARQKRKRSYTLPTRQDSSGSTTITRPGSHGSQ